MDAPNRAGLRAWLCLLISAAAAIFGFVDTVSGGSEAAVDLWLAGSIGMMFAFLCFAHVASRRKT